MKRFKILFLSISLVFVIAVFPVLFIVYPAYSKHVFLHKEEKVLRAAEGKSELILKTTLRNSDTIALLQEKLHAESPLSFLEDALNKSQLLIQSIKPDQGSEHKEIHLVLKGEYRALLNFISLLSRQPNSLIFIDLLVEKDHMNIVLKSEDGSEKKAVAIKAKSHLSLAQRLASALTDIKVPSMPRVLPKNKIGLFQPLKEVDWCLSGEVRQNGGLLGVFLKAKEGVQSHYFGIYLPWENSHWRVIRITRHAVVFEEPKQHLHWSLYYCVSP